MNNFWTRTLTGAVFVVVMAGSILWNIWSYLGLFSLIALAGLWEFYTLLGKTEKGIQKLPGMMLGMVLLGASAGKYFLSINLIPNIQLLEVLMLIFPILLIFKLFGKDPITGSLSPTLLGILYVVLPFCYLILSYSYVGWYNSENNARIILGFFILIWSNDTFAYLVGRTVGKTKLFERISPKKTWEGTIGGIICTQGLAFVLSLYFTELALIHWLAIGFIVSVTGTLGDLVESKFKRNLEVKDSGNILPGHGGVLDRFDGVLLAVPFVVAYLCLVN